MKLTIGMAQYDDFDGVYFTVQALRTYHPELMADVELILVNNSPHAPSSQYVMNLINDRARPGTWKTRYIEMSDPVGTSPTRQRIFDEATGDVVLCMDSHILFWKGALHALLDYFAKNPESSDLISGPLMHDNMVQCQTHFDDNWRAEMWGTWGAAWHCKCGFEGLHFATTQNEGALGYRALKMGQIPVTECFKCKQKLPETGYSNHEKQLMLAGYRMLADQEQPFEIPGQGLGVFACRREAWLGFNEHANKFGGEEMYIHEKFRQAGHKAICLPKLKWVHRFGRPDGVKYPLTRLGKVRNYVLEFNELGRPLDEIHQHFVIDTKSMSQSDWDELVADPIEIAFFQDKNEECGTCGQGKAVQLVEGASSIEEVFIRACSITRDLDQHLPALREYASSVDRVCEISNRIESSVAFLASSVGHLELHNTEQSRGLKKMIQLRNGDEVDAEAVLTFDDKNSSQLNAINECDLLFIDSTHTYERLLYELRTFHLSVKRYIIMHDTQVHGQTGEDGGPGMLKALREFMREQPQWSVIHHTNNQYGLTVIGCVKSDKPKMPPLTEQIKNFAGTMTKHLKEGAEYVSSEIFEERLDRCSWCDQRVNSRCAQCGCFIETKSPMAVAVCDLGRWER